jgi:hypothetical protein
MKENAAHEAHEAMALDKSQELNRCIPHNTHQDDEEKEISA